MISGRDSGQDELRVATKKTSWHENAFNTILVLGEAKPPFTNGVPSQRASNAEFWCIFLVILNQPLDRQPSYRWFEPPWCSYDVTVMYESDPVAYHFQEACYTLHCPYWT